MNNYTDNKRPKDTNLCKTITKVLTKDRRENGYTKEEQAIELGLSVGTLANKLKPANTINDISISEFVHILELTGDYEPLKYLNTMFDLVAIEQEIKVLSDAKKVALFTDNAQMEANDVFSVAKRAIS
ncbi:MAG: phage regulatory CII family protein, partial [Arcobacteraceae bacterium]